MKPGREGRYYLKDEASYMTTVALNNATRIRREGAEPVGKGLAEPVRRYNLA